MATTALPACGDDGDAMIVPDGGPGVDDGGPGTDGGGTDSGSSDGGTVDGGNSDGGGDTDAGVIDAGPIGPCSAGEFLGDDEVCAACPEGTWSAGGSASGCTAWSHCTPGSFVSGEPSASADRACEPCAAGSFSTAEDAASCTAHESCAAGTAPTSAPSSTSDVECAACAPGSYCAGGAAESVACTGETVDHDADPATACATRATCPAGTSVTSNGDATTDRVCAPCAAGSFSSAANATNCTPFVTCAPGSRVSEAGSSTSPRVCTECASGTFSTTENAMECTTWATCAAGSFVQSAGTATTDRTCSPCAANSYSSTANAASCTPFETCAPGTRVSEAGSSTSPRVCTACASGTFSSSSNASTCTTWTTCAAGTFVQSAGSATTDRTCTACASGSYSSTTNAASCTAFETCMPGTRVSDAGSSTTPRVCTACTSGTYSSTNNATACSTWSNCSAGTFVQSAGSATTNRTCSPCASNSYSSTTNAASCTPFVTCAPGTRVSTAGSSTTARVCTDCASGTYSTTTNATACSTWSNCSAGSYVQSAGSATSNRTCSACASGQFSSTTNATACAPWATCGAGLTEQQTPSASANRTCAPFASVASWVRSASTVVEDHAQQVYMESDGSVLVVGTTEGNMATGADLNNWAQTYVRRYTGSGTAVWNHQYGPPYSTSGLGYGAEAGGVGVSSDGTVYVVGAITPSTTGASGTHFVHRRFAPAGAITTSEWPIPFGTRIDGMVMNGNGESFVFGQVSFGGVFPGQTALGGSDAFVMLLDASGSAMWVRQFGTSANEYITDGVMDSSGRVYLVGTVEAGGTFPGQSTVDGTFVRAYDRYGAVLWTRQYVVGDFQTRSMGIGLAADGNLRVISETNGDVPGDSRYGSRAHVAVLSTATGATLSQFVYGGGLGEPSLLMHRATIRTDGSVLLAGASWDPMPGHTEASGAEDANHFIIELTPTGALRRARGFDAHWLSWIRSIAPTSDGGVVFAMDVQASFAGLSYRGEGDSIVARLPN